MLTILKAKANFDKEWRRLREKDQTAIRKVEELFKNHDTSSYKFLKKVYDIYPAYKLQVPHIATVLEEYLDTPIFNIWFDTTFSKAKVYSILADMQFLATLMRTNLLRRTANLDRHSDNQLKLRVYIAVLNYDRYKKSQIPSQKQGRRKTNSSE